MIKELIHDPIFLGMKSEVATKEDLQVAQDMLDTLAANKAEEVIDLVENGVFRGGNISPGVRTRFRALHDYTSRLPQCEATDEILSLGRTTQQAIEQGVMEGITHEIEGYIRAFSLKNDKLTLIFTGGDANFFVKRIKNAIFAKCDLVLCGLNRILEYNAKF